MSNSDASDSEEEEGEARAAPSCKAYAIDVDAPAVQFIRAGQGLLQIRGAVKFPPRWLGDLPASQSSDSIESILHDVGV